MFFNIFGNFNDNFTNNLPPRRWSLIPIRYPRKSKFNCTSKVMLPMSILSDLSIFNFQPPYIFEISHSNEIFRTKCSVAEFVDYEGEVCVPSWIYEQLNLHDAKSVYIKYVKVLRGEGIKLLPHSIDFLEVENPKAALENGLREYPILSSGDEIAINFDDFGILRFTISAIFPESLDSIYTVDTDLNVEFDEPIGYQEKLESEKTVMKYANHSENGIVKMDDLSLFLDFEDLTK